MNTSSSLRPAITYITKKLSVFAGESYLHVINILTVVPVTLCYTWFIFDSSL